MARKRLGEILIEAGVLDEARLRAALVEQRRWGGQLGRILIDMRLISEDVLVQALSRQLNIPAVNLDSRDIPDEVIELVPGDIAEQHGLVPFHLEGKFLDVAMTDPTNLGIVDELRIRTQLNVRPYLAGPKMIERALRKYYGRGNPSMPLMPAAGVDPAVAVDPAVMTDGMQLVDLERPAAPAAGSPAMTAAQIRAHGAALHAPPAPADAAIANLQERIAKLEALVHRDEDVLRKLMGLLVQKGVATREEILAAIK
ncbi:MAG: general secretion pathway protein GspE [Deltaproteobacteria bacterium]|nr:MAG: general secretion pathway protein GspE [Deltaproteobacteria bacterium]